MNFFICDENLIKMVIYKFFALRIENKTVNIKYKLINKKPFFKRSS